MPLKGSLETFTLANVLQFLCNDRKTGILSVSNNTTEYQIFFLEGSIIHAVKSREAIRLGQLLRNSGLITLNQLNECLEEAKKQKLALGKILLAKGYISKKILEKHIYMQTEEIISRLFLWETGQFEYKDAKINLKWLVVTKLNVLQLIVDATRRVDEVNAKLNKKLDFNFPSNNAN